MQRYAELVEVELSPRRPESAGMRVSIAFVGDVDDSDPAYANATEIVILERPED